MAKHSSTERGIFCRHQWTGLDLDDQYLITNLVSSKIPQGSRIEKSIKSMSRMETSWRVVGGEHGQQIAMFAHALSLCLVTVRPSEKPNYLALPSAGGPVSDRSA